MFDSSNWVKSRCLTQVIELSQNVDMKTQLNNQSNLYDQRLRHHCIKYHQWRVKQE